MNKVKFLIAMAALIVAPAAFTKELKEIRFVSEKTIGEIRYAGNQPGTGFAIMSLEELRSWNPKYHDATDDTLVPAMEPIKYKALSPSN